MPTIDHKDLPSIQPPTPVKSAAETLAAAAVAQGVKSVDFEAQILAVMKKLQQEAVSAPPPKPKEPDWATLTEADALKRDVYIPIIEHEIPSYMDMKLKDPEYEAVWVNKNPARIGQYQAMGYEPVRVEHVHPDFKPPMKPTSEGEFVYIDVICMRAKKSIVWGRRKRALQISQDQLRRADKKVPVHRVGNSMDLSEEVTDFGPGLSLYDTARTSI